jgi:hypothetical protein
MFIPALYSYLQFDCIVDIPEPNTEETAYRVWQLLVDRYFSKQDPLSSRAAKNLQMYLISLRMCITYATLSCRILLLALLINSTFVQFVFSEIPRESAWGILFRPPWCWLLLSNCNVSELDSVEFWASYSQNLATSCRKFLYCIFCVCLALRTQKCIEDCTV